jgi:hypothetical protein
MNDNFNVHFDRATYKQIWGSLQNLESWSIIPNGMLVQWKIQYFIYNLSGWVVQYPQTQCALIGNTPHIHTFTLNTEVVLSTVTTNNLSE